MPPPRRYSDEQYAEAKGLIDDGASMAEAARSTGIGYQSLRKRLHGGSDPKPGGRARVKVAKPAATDEQLATLFGKLASAPAVPMALLVHCDYCATHFANTGPDAATKLVELSRDHPALRGAMESIWRYADEVAWAGVLATWLGVPIAHHLAPEFIYRYLSMFMGMPPRGVVPETNGHVHTPPTATPAPTPYAGMDTESLLHMAEQMGIKVEPAVNGNEDAPEPESPEPTAEPDAEPADDTAPAAPAAADSDAG